MNILLFAYFSKTLAKITNLSTYLSECFQQEIELAKPSWFKKKEFHAVIGWGKKSTALKAINFAKTKKIKYIAVEDGFLRSIEPGQKSTPYSLVIDDVGIYYDANSNSRLEKLIGQSLTAEQQQRAQKIITLWCKHRVSKYNHLREYNRDLPEEYVLVADQTYGDASVTLGMATGDSFKQMLQAALDENPTATVLVKIHPEVASGKKQGYFDIVLLRKNPRIQILDKNVHPVGLIEQARKVYVVTSQIGFEALLWSKPVRVFGMPFYAGWGLTADELVAPTRRQQLSLEQLVHATLVDYPIYLDPESDKICQVEQLIEWISFQRQMRNRLPEKLCVLGFSWRKQQIAKGFLQGSQLTFKSWWNLFTKVPADATLALWGMKPLPQKYQGRKLVRIEDGFLRSVGLGAALVKPLSWVVDNRGIYFDATRESDLEYMLNNFECTDEMLEQAAQLRKLIIAKGLTKYNVGNKDVAIEFANKPQQKKILVVGQVEGDMSLKYGAVGVNTNIGLLQEVRCRNPNAYLIYKPHPDVAARLRKGVINSKQYAMYYDQILTDVAIDRLYPLVDEVHVMTSLAGFEALIRDVTVVCYGAPFYAGWGLTSDIVSTDRRRRILSINYLVFISIILYPLYIQCDNHKITNIFNSISSMRI